jgi:transmembrane sensor
VKGIDTVQLERQIEDLQAMRASEWLEILRRGRPEEVAAFRAWLERSPVHIREFLEITYADRELMALDANREEDLDALLNEIRPRVEPLARSMGAASSTSGTEKLRHRLWRWGLAAGVVAAALASGWYGRSWLGSHEYSTRVGELRTVELVDRSVVTLNTDSDIKVEFEDDERNVELRHGEAVFKVAHDPNRPFRVRTRAGVIQALGTQFNVYDRGQQGTDVAVLDGRVRLTPHAASGSRASIGEELFAGQEARIGLDGAIRRAARADVERVIAWSKRRLKFDDAPLEDIVAEFNRYRQNLRLRLESVPPGAYQYTGIFDADDPDTLARFLQREGDLVVSRTEREIVIRLQARAGERTIDR